MELFRFDKDRVAFKKTDILAKYKALVATLAILFSLTLISAMKLKTEINTKEIIIKQKEDRIKTIRTPLRKQYYIEDLQKAIGFNLTPKQHKIFVRLALKYREQIEEAKVPATLVWWVACKESGFDLKAKNPDSSSKGLFGFIDGTWEEVCKMKGYSTDGRNNEEKQVRVMLDYLNYLYNKHGSWKEGMQEYHGQVYQYPVLFLFK